MPQLASVIEKAANVFARSIIAAVKAATLQELLALEGGAPRRGGRPPKAVGASKAKPKAKRRAKIKWPKCKHRGCKKNAWSRGKGFCGEHAKVAKAAKKSAKKVAKKATKTPARKRRKINYPKCSVPGCGKNRYARGNGMCGTHFKAAAKRTGKKPVRKVAKKAAMAAPKRSAENRRSISSPKCSVQGCGKNRYPRGKGMCGEHYKAALAK